MNLMNKFLMVLAIVAVFSSCKSKNVEQESMNPIVSTNNGKVQGVLVDDGKTTVFRGIPYAAPPVGDLRWKKPQPAANWDTVRICDTFSSAAIQASHSDPEEFYTKEFYWEGDPEFSEDCLYLNVWTPTEAASHPEKKLPVAMWIHGGAYTHGWGFEVTMDGESWAKQDVILVTIWKSHATLTLLAKQDLPTFGYNTIDPLKPWCWGSLLFYPFKISHFS